MENRVFQKKVDTRILNEADRIYHDLGTSVSEAFVMFLRKSIEVQGLPFELRKPTRAQMEAELSDLLERKFTSGRRLDFSKKEDVEEFFDEEY